jgi:hypothetical protein
VFDKMTKRGLRRGIAADLHLHAPEAAGAITFGLSGEVVDRLALLIEATRGIGLDALTAPAEETVERQPRDFACDVPEDAELTVRAVRIARTIMTAPL